MFASNQTVKKEQPLSFSCHRRYTALRYETLWQNAHDAMSTTDAPLGRSIISARRARTWERSRRQPSAKAAEEFNIAPARRKKIAATKLSEK
jgi:hypothetical protein